MGQSRRLARCDACVTSLHVLIWPWFTCCCRQGSNSSSLLHKKCAEEPGTCCQEIFIFSGVQSPAWLDSKLFPVIFFCAVSVSMHMRKMLRDGFGKTNMQPPVPFSSARSGCIAKNMRLRVGMNSVVHNPSPRLSPARAAPPGILGPWPRQETHTTHYTNKKSPPGGHTY